MRELERLLGRKTMEVEILSARRRAGKKTELATRRIRRLINRQRKANGKPPVNGKRVLRIMRSTN